MCLQDRSSTMVATDQFIVPRVRDADSSITFAQSKTYGPYSYGPASSLLGNSGKILVLDTRKVP